MGGVNNRSLFKKNRLLFSLLFSGNFSEGQGCDERKQSCDGRSLPPGKTL